MEKQIQLETVVQAATDTLRNSLYISMPGAVLAYNPANKTATVQPMVSDPRVNLETGQIVFEPWLPIPNVPVKWPSFGGFVICGFLEPGDQVMLEAFDLDPSAWRAQGKSIKPTNPGDTRRLSGGYWRAEPTDLTVTPIVSAPTSPGMVFGLDGGLQQIVIAPSGVAIGGPSAQPLMTATAQAAIVTFATALAAIPPATNPATTMANVNSVTALGSALESGVGGASAATTILKGA